MGSVRKRKQLVGLPVESISLGKRQEDNRAEIQITYRFGPPPASEGGCVEGLSMPVLKKGRPSITPAIDAPTLTVVVAK